MAIHDGDQEFWLRLIKIRDPLALGHEVSGFVFIPGALCLIEHGNAFNRGRRVLQICIAKVMNVLNEAPHFAGSLSPGDRLTAFFGSSLFVAGKGFTQHIDQRAVTGEEHRVFLS